MLDIFEPFIGCWEAADGASRQKLSWGLDRRVVRSLMWFRTDDGWKLVSEGAFHRDPARDRVVGFAATSDMPVTQFDIVARDDGEGLTFDNTAYAPDGTPLETTELWRSPTPDTFTWRLFQHADGVLLPWMDGEWKRLPAGGRPDLERVTAADVRRLHDG